MTADRLEAKTLRVLAGVPTGFLPWAILAQARDHRRLFYVAPDDASAALVIDCCRSLDPDVTLLSFPAWDCLPYDRSGVSPTVSAQRLSTLRDLAQPQPAGHQIIVTTANALLQRHVAAASVAQRSTRLAAGTSLDRDALISLLSQAGYRRAESVAEPGDFAVRGGLIDLWPAGAETPARLDFFGDTIDRMRWFDASDQRSIGDCLELSLLPIREAALGPDTIRRFRQGYLATFGAEAAADMLYQSVTESRPFGGEEHWLPLFEERLEVLFDHCRPGDCVLLDAAVPAAIEQRFAAIADYYQSRKEALGRKAQSMPYRPLAPDQLYLSPEQWRDALTQVDAVQLTTFPPLPGQSEAGGRAGRDFSLERQRNAGGIYDSVTAHIRSRLASRAAVLVAASSAGSADRLTALLHEHGLEGLSPGPASLGLSPEPATARIVVLPIEHGFETQTLCVLTEADILGERMSRPRRPVRKAERLLREIATLTPGDLVVHYDHGIGRFDGLKTITAAGAPHDCVALSYQDGDKLFVPVENIEVLTRYGAENDSVTLDKLGGAAWQSRKARLKERIKAIADDLLRVAAERALRQAEALNCQTADYDAFCARFPYAETEDQARAVADVTEDLSSGKPMDRLVCGDVGFGKTEVALRAAYLAAMNGLQVAVVCPTTLLARQHAATFQARFEGFPLQVGQLSRLVSAGDVTRFRAGLADGTLDIVVGTHALLGKAISFKRLGLVIVDEEQHFGVTHKERLKQLRADVHVLTLTATPIPRTLQMAMSGIRDLSLIATPPIDRLAVRTYVSPFDPVVIREALMREHFRGGQSFLVCPRIADLDAAMAFLRTQVPEVKAVVAHGQMSPGDIEERMTAFVDRRFDVLVSTTIVESGLDIPNANTMVVMQADHFGLSQLYQLRGRVGRSKTRAYAYLTTTEDKPITVQAQRRLEVLASLDGLGAGFTLASHDLDIRGAGNLLGDEQSGHVREIGFELYQQMLEEAVLKAKAEQSGLKPAEEYSPQITIGAAVLLPEAYVPDLGVRMGLYRRIGDLKDRPQIDAFAAELIDRFGKLPREVRTLLQIVEMKVYCRQAEVSKVDVGAKGAIISFREDRFPNPAGLVQLLGRMKGQARFRPDQKLVYLREFNNEADRMTSVLALLKGLAGVANQAAAAA
jgi:transcription-repair coupling factor (superfamily II helicase)